MDAAHCIRARSVKVRMDATSFASCVRRVGRQLLCKGKLTQQNRLCLLTSKWCAAKSLQAREHHLGQEAQVSDAQLLYQMSLVIQASCCFAGLFLPHRWTWLPTSEQCTEMSHLCWCSSPCWPRPHAARACWAAPCVCSLGFDDDRLRVRHWLQQPWTKALHCSNGRQSCGARPSSSSSSGTLCLLCPLLWRRLSPWIHHS